MTRQPKQFSQSAVGVRCAAVSDVGMRRANNQDSLAVDLAGGKAQFESRGHLLLVADGMGAHAAGELASQIAADTIPHAYQKRLDLSPADALVAAVQEANSRINSKGQNSVDFQGMGTTCSSLVLLPTGAIVAHVGDSRVYRLRGTSLEQLTFDHSLVWEMAAAGQASEDQVPAYVPKNVITRSLGPNDAVKVDLEGPFELRRGDRYLICSDGLTGPLTADLLGMIVGALPPDEAAQTLVDLANLLGGPDNVTVVVAEIDDSADFASPEAGQLDATIEFSRPNSTNWTAIALLFAALAGVGLSAVCLASQRIALGITSLAAAAMAGIGAWLMYKPASRREATATPMTLKSGSRASLRGKAPYRHYRVEPDRQSIETLSDIVRQLEDLETQTDWQFDWSEIHADRHEAHQAIAAGDYHAATVAYASAVRRLMQAVSENEPPKPGGSSINLGEE